MYTEDWFWNKKVAISYTLAIFVFFIHNSSYSQYIYDNSNISQLCLFLSKLFPAVGGVAVPLFMIISGTLFFRNFKPKYYIVKLKKRVTSLLLPYLAWNTIAMLFSILTTIYFSQYFIGRQPFEFSIESVFRSVLFRQENGPFWFVGDLIIYIAISPIIYALIHNKLIGGGFY